MGLSITTSPLSCIYISSVKSAPNGQFAPMSDTNEPRIPAYPGTDRPAGPDAESQAVPEAHPDADEVALPSETEGRE